MSRVNAQPVPNGGEPIGEQEACANWHAMPPDAVLAELRVGDDGLDAEEAETRRARYGANALPEDGGNEALKILVRQIRDPLIYVLLASTVLAMLTGKMVDGAVICGVVVLNAIIGFVQEFRASRAIKALTGMVPNEAAVLRSGQKIMLPAVDLVPGDVVFLQSGDKVPADVRLIAARGLMVEEAALTGESVPVGKTVKAVAAEALIGDRTSLAFSGTLVTFGTAKGVVVATGGQTELGRISRMLGETTELMTPLTRQLGVIGSWIAIAVVIVSVLLLGIGLARGYPLADAILAAVTLAVAAIPEGLPAIVTIALAIGVQRMARRRAIIRKLPAVETLGSTTVICSDKTGTLTRNEMTVRALWTPDGAYRLSGIGYATDGALVDDDAHALSLPAEDARTLGLAGALCNDAALHETESGWQVAGDPTEGALLVAATKLGLDPQEVRARHRRLDTIAFESERQFMATLHADPEGGAVIYLKGAPEVVLRRCRAADARLAEHITANVLAIAAQGMRVLAFAVRRPLAPIARLDADAVADDFVFLGLQGMIDPPREEAVRAVQACRRAGITVKMITGDHKETARAIGLDLGLVAPGEDALSGTELARYSEQALRAAVRTHNVFARVAPEHKLKLVQALQANGEVVAMTGDGVNDAPALKQADIGVAMGITGTAASKEAADMVLADDNFASIEAAVEEGRRVYDNLIKALAFVLPTNLGLALILIVAVAFFPIVDGEALLPMLPVQILWINLIAAVALALPLALEAMEPNLMNRPPRSPDAPVLNAFVVARTFVVAALMAAGAVGMFLHEYFVASPQVASHPASVSALARAEAQTEAVTAVVMFQIFYLLNCRSLKNTLLDIGLWSNPWVYLGIAVVLVLQLAFTYLPVMNVVFGSAPLSLASWIEATAVAWLIMPIIGCEKWLARRRAGRG